jgi:hypothetical protein
VETASVSNPGGINLTAYAVHDETNDFVTVINKEYGNAATPANVTIILPGKAKHAEVIYLSPPNGDVTARTGVTLGGAAVTPEGTWKAAKSESMHVADGKLSVRLPAYSAAICTVV